MKQCSKCGEQKPLSEFQKRLDRPLGYHSQCKKCRNNACKLWAAANKNQVKEYNKVDKLKRNWGLTPDEFLEMQLKQNNVCGICQNSFKSSKDTHIDHCHSTGKIRGILCSNCNHALGKFKDSTDILQSAIMYLNKYKENKNGK